MKHIQSSIPAVLPLLFGAALAAQTATTSVDRSVQASYEKSLGSANNGVEFTLDARAAFDRDLVAGSHYDRRSELTAEARAVVHLFGTEREAVEVEGEVFAERMVDSTATVGGTVYASYRQSGGGSGHVDIGGATKWSLSDWSVSALSSRTYEREFGPFNVFPTDPSMTFWIGPLPVTLHGNAGASAGFLLALRTNPATPRVEASGTVFGKASGWAELTVGLMCAHVSLRIELTFGHVEAGPVMRAAEGDVGGDLEFELTPIELSVEVEASWCTGSATETLFHYSAPTISSSLPLS